MFLLDTLKPLKLLRQEEVTTYLAADTQTGQSYLLHWLPADGSPAFTNIVAMLDDLPEEARKLIVEAGRRDGRAYLVTQNPPTFLGLEAWLKAVHDFLGYNPLEKKGAWRVPAELLAPPANPAPNSPTDLTPTDLTMTTQMLIQPEGPANPESPAPKPAVSPAPQRPSGRTQIFIPPVPPPVPSAPAPSMNEPGEFTRMFMAPPARQPTEASTPTEVSGQFELRSGKPATELTRKVDLSAPLPPEQPGEFTQLLRMSSAPPVPSPDKALGEFTQIMSGLSPKAEEPARLTTQPQATQPQAPPPPPSPAPQRSTSEPGEFTRMLMRPDQDPTLVPSSSQPPATASQPPRAQPTPEPGEFTRMFGSPSAANEWGANSAPPPAKPAPASAPGWGPPSAQEREPGEFTKLLRTPVAGSTPVLPKEDPFHAGFQAPSQNSNTGSWPASAANPQRSSAPGSATQMYAKPVPQSPVAAGLPEGPSDYTRLFAGPPSAAAASAPPAVAAPVDKGTSAKAPAKPEPALWIFIGVLALLALCAIAAIVYFGMKR